jgi:hypothetical protein
VSKREELAARAARQASRRRSAEPPAAEPPAAAEPVSTAPLSRRVRITVDLLPVLHRQLSRWCTSAATELEVAKVPAAEVIRALLRELDEDEELAARVRARVRRELAQ